MVHSGVSLDRGGVGQELGSQRSSTDPLHDLDLGIEITLRRLSKARNIVVNNSNSSNSISSSNNSNPVTNNSDSFEYSSINNFAKSEQMKNNDRTLKELAIRDVTYESKSGLIHLLPKFHGLAGEDPHKHLKEFHVVCSIIRPQGILEDYIKMKAFPFSLDGAAISATSSLQHLGRHETHVFGEVLFDITNYDHQERNMWDKPTF
ncbi:hypothetical protein CR513_31585, partial [Mucuna pruriens]